MRQMIGLVGYCGQLERFVSTGMQTKYLEVLAKIGVYKRTNFYFEYHPNKKTQKKRNKDLACNTILNMYLNNENIIYYGKDSPEPNVGKKLR